MEAWKVLKRAIPEGMAKTVAHRYGGVGANHVLRWRREPLSDEAPLSTGQRSPVDRVCDLIDAVFLINPIGAALISEYVWAHYYKIRDTISPKTVWDKRQHAAHALHEAVEAVNCLNLDSPDQETITEIVEARDALDAALVHLGYKNDRGPRRIEIGERAS